jgi:hypothetical protein
MSRVYAGQRHNRNNHGSTSRARGHRGSRIPVDRGPVQTTMSSLTTVTPFPRKGCTTGRVVLADVPYSEGTGSKRRPVVVLRSLNDHDVSVLRCTTSRAWAERLGFIEISHLESCGLSRRTWVDPNPVIVERRTIITASGYLSSDDVPRILGSSARSEALSATA